MTTLPFLSRYHDGTLTQQLTETLTIPILTGLYVCLIPTTISGLLSATGIAGMDRLIKRNVIAKAVELLKQLEMLMSFF